MIGVKKTTGTTAAATAVKVESHTDLKISQCHNTASHIPTAAQQNETPGCVQPHGAAAAAVTRAFFCRIIVNLPVSGDRKCMQTKIINNKQTTTITRNGQQTMAQHFF